jgi:hypothetical protein
MTISANSLSNSIRGGPHRDYKSGREGLEFHTTDLLPGLPLEDALYLSYLAKMVAKESVRIFRPSLRVTPERRSTPELLRHKRGPRGLPHPLTYYRSRIIHATRLHSVAAEYQRLTAGLSPAPNAFHG